MPGAAGVSSPGHAFKGILQELGKASQPPLMLVQRYIANRFAGNLSNVVDRKTRGSCTIRGSFRDVHLVVQTQRLRHHHRRRTRACHCEGEVQTIGRFSGIPRMKAAPAKIPEPPQQHWGWLRGWLCTKLDRGRSYSGGPQLVDPMQGPK